MAKKRVAVYFRLPAEYDVGTLVKSYEKRVASREDCEWVDAYVDRGSSGMNANRPMFQKIIADAKAGKINYIVCKSVAKFSRDASVAIKTIKELCECGVGVFFEVENINTLDPSTKTMLAMYAATVEFEQHLRAMEKQFEAEHPEWLEDDFDEPDEPDEFV